MNDDVVNMSLRKFLKKVGVTSQREIENAVKAALESGRLRGNETLKAEVRLTMPEAGLDVVIDGAIELE
jgi:ribosomal protein L1